MSKKPEQRLWDRVRDGLIQASRAPSVLAMGNHPLYLDRVENLASPSMPDVFGRWAGFDFWIELKVAYNTGPSGVHFQPGQTSWLARQWACRQNAFLLVTPSERTDWSLFRGEQAPEIEDYGTREIHSELNGGCGGISGWLDLLERITWGGCPDACRCTESAK